MRKTILLKSRYGETHRLERIGEKDSHLFLFVPADRYYRIGIDSHINNSIEFVDPSGGPFIYVGGEVEGNIVKYISKKEQGIVIEFE